ncbi:MAG3450 family membrane protein [Mycoplasmopsis lipofaciens]|uniref:MAG3450 family membrane protein n=1 Tax=Mycoplasmopsis lipofaciens TaxID=114884 RepID=UPI000482F9FA|nr:hypothetical protein [Mycoplasmopsis lipofaciens]
MNRKEKKQIKSYKPLTTILFTIIFVILPMMIIWIFGSNDFQNRKIINDLYVYLIVFIIIFVGTLLNIAFYIFKIISIKSFNINIPLFILFMFIIFSSFSNLNIYIRLIIAIFLIVLFTLLINIIIGKIEDKINNIK